jgi:hypothetical protein
MFVTTRKPSPQTAYRNLKRHLLALGAWVAFVRVLPYALQAVQDSQKSK